jgi:hypothetical protein
MVTIKSKHKICRNRKRCLLAHEGKLHKNKVFIPSAKEELLSYIFSPSFLYDISQHITMKRTKIIKMKKNQNEHKGKGCMMQQALLQYMAIKYIIYAKPSCTMLK